MNGNEPNTPPRRVTIIDVAQAAGVSRQTVSRAINGRGEISESTRQRVLDVAAELGYRPNSIARSLKTNRTMTLGVLVPDIANPFFAEVVRGASEAAHAQGYAVLLCNANEDVEREWSLLAALEAQRVDGLMLISPRLDQDRLDHVAQRWPPVVAVNRHLPERAGSGSVLIKDAVAARKATEHLLDRGHRAIAFLGFVPGSHSAQQRLAGFWEALQDAEVPFQTNLLVRCEPTVEGGLIAGRELLDHRSDVTAVLAYNDLVALGLMRACAERNVLIPHDCAVVGYDDIVFASHVTPPLTTVHVPVEQLGHRAMELLLDLVRDPKRSGSEIELEADLIVREST